MLTADLALANLDKGLGLTADIQAAYDLAPGHVRRLMNQSIFDKLLIRDEEVVGHVLAEPFRQLLADDLPEALTKPSSIPQVPQGKPVGALVGVGVEDERTADLFLAGGSINEVLVELAGLEPATSWVRSTEAFGALAAKTS